MKDQEPDAAGTAAVSDVPGVPDAAEDAGRRWPLMAKIWPLVVLSMAYAWFYTCENQWFNSYVQNVVLHDLPDRAFYVAFMGSCSAIFGLVFYLLFGAISDARDPRQPPGGKRKVFVIGAIVAGTAMVFVPFQPPGVAGYWLVFLIDVPIIGIAANAGLITRDVSVPDLVEEKHRGRANGYLGIAEGIGGVLVMGVSALVILLFPPPEALPAGQLDPNGQVRHQFIIVPGGLFLVVAAVLVWFFIREDETRPPNWTPVSWTTILRQNFDRVELQKPENKNFLKFFGIKLLVTIGDKIYLPYIIIFITSEAQLFLGFGEVVGLLLAYGVAFVLAYTVLPRYVDRVGRKAVTIPCCLAAGVGFILFSLFLKVALPLALLGLFFGAFGSQAFVVATRTWGQDLLPVEKRGNFAGILNVTATISQIPGLYIGAAVLTYLGMEWIFLFAGLFYASLFWLFAYVPDDYQERLQATRGKVQASENPDPALPHPRDKLLEEERDHESHHPPE